MNWFKQKKSEEKKDGEKKVKQEKSNTTHKPSGLKTIDIIKAPRMTEKAALLNEKGVYVFEVQPKTTKTQIQQAIAIHYGVTPMSVRTARTQGKPLQNRRTGIRGKRNERKIAFVQLKKGDTIDLSV